MRQTKSNLDKILKHTKFDSNTKALWAYFRGNKSADGFRGERHTKAQRLILVNLHLNGALRNRLEVEHYQAMDMQWVRDAIQTCVWSFRPETIAHWNHAIKLIDIAKGARS